MERCADVWRCLRCQQEWLAIRAGLLSWELIALEEQALTTETYLLTGPAPAVCPHCNGPNLPDALIYYPDQRPADGYEPRWYQGYDPDIS